MKKFVPLVVLGVILGLVVLGQLARRELGIEVSTASIRDWVGSFGWQGPAFFVLLVILRSFLVLPSAIVLSSGGLVFGVTYGTVWGAIGLFLSATLLFVLGRGVGRDWLPDGLRRLFERADVSSVGPLLVGVMTAHPMGPLTPTHWAAGFSAVSWFGFYLAIALTVPVRAFTYAFFGASIAEMNGPQIAIATALLLAVMLLPLMHPKVREQFKRFTQ